MTECLEKLHRARWDTSPFSVSVGEPTIMNHFVVPTVLARQFDKRFFTTKLAQDTKLEKFAFRNSNCSLRPLDIAAQDMLCALCAQYSPLSCGFAAPG
jgi:hypothetical protein